MNIVVNAVLAYEQPRGVGTHINNVLIGLSEIDEDNEYYIYYGKWMKKYSFLNINRPNFHFIELDISRSIISRNWYLAVKLPIDCKKYNPDILYVLDTQAILVKPCRIVSTIHDLAEFECKYKYSKLQGAIRRCIVRHQIKLSDQLITVSQYSKDDILRRFNKNISGDNIHVIYNTYDGVCDGIADNHPDKYILFVSEVERAKNLKTLLQAYNILPAEIKGEYSVKVVGKHGNDYDECVDYVNENKLESKVEFYGYVDNSRLDFMYKKAYVFVFPSLFEGFGIPVIEAMGRGVPVICSNSSSLPEVGDTAALFFNPMDYNELADCLIRVINNENLRSSMINKGLERARFFASENMAEKTYKVLLDAKS